MPTYWNERITAIKPGFALEFNGACFDYPQSDWRGLHEIDLQIDRGTVLILRGANGSGKSTLLRLISGNLSPTRGSVLVGGSEAGHDRRVAYVEQSPAIDWSFPIDVRRFVLFGRYVHRGPLRRYRGDDHARVDAIMRELELAESSELQIAQLSGGQRQRAVIGRALAQDADVYLFDEPLNSLDDRSAHIVSKVVDRLRSAGRTVVLVTHDTERLGITIDVVAYLNDGLIAPERVGI